MHNVYNMCVHPVCSCLSGTLVDGVQSCLQLIRSIEPVRSLIGQLERSK